MCSFLVFLFIFFLFLSVVVCICIFFVIVYAISIFFLKQKKHIFFVDAFFFVVRKNDNIFVYLFAILMKAFIRSFVWIFVAALNIGQTSDSRKNVIRCLHFELFVYRIKLEVQYFYLIDVNWRYLYIFIYYVTYRMISVENLAVELLTKSKIGLNLHQQFVGNNQL